MARPSDEAREKLTPENREVFDWFYEILRDSPYECLIFGMAVACAIEDQEKPFWQVLKEVMEIYKRNFSQ